MIMGVSAGKFMPPHLGHKYMIDQASERCDELNVLVCDRPEYPIPIEQRLNWLREIHPGVNFIPVKDLLADDDSPGWAKLTIDTLGRVPNKVFTSENYGEHWAKALNASHICIDKAREVVTISGTEVRQDPWASWDYLHPIVKGFFARRFCVVGAESSGTTTLTQSLADHYDTNWVEEYGRDYSVEQQARLEKEGWKTEDFIKIANEQNKLEDDAATKCNRLLLCDTDSFATSIWHERYMEKRSYQVEELAVERKYDLYLLTDPSIPFVQDGYRDGEHMRNWMHQRFIEKLLFWEKPYVVISGSKDERLDQAITLIDKIIDNNAVDLPGLNRNHWHSKGGF